MAAVVASSMAKVTVAPATPAQLHADPRFHMARAAADNDVDATLDEEEELRLNREAAADEEWIDTTHEPDADDLGWLDEEG